MKFILSLSFNHNAANGWMKKRVKRMNTNEC